MFESLPLRHFLMYISKLLTELGGRRNPRSGPATSELVHLVRRSLGLFGITSTRHLS